MSENKLHSLEKIGYTKDVPEASDLDKFETISVKSKSGKNITLYRNKSEKEEFDEISDFNRSWDLYNSYLDLDWDRKTLIIGTEIIKIETNNNNPLVTRTWMDGIKLWCISVNEGLGKSIFVQIPFWYPAYNKDPQKTNNEIWNNQKAIFNQLLEKKDTSC